MRAPVTLQRLNEMKARREPIVMVTASVQPHHRVQAEQAEVDGFIAKPFEPDELLAMVGILAASGRA